MDREKRAFGINSGSHQRAHSGGQNHKVCRQLGRDTLDASTHTQLVLMFRYVDGSHEGARTFFWNSSPWQGQLPTRLQMSFYRERSLFRQGWSDKAKLMEQAYDGAKGMCGEQVVCSKRCVKILNITVMCIAVHTSWIWSYSKTCPTFIEWDIGVCLFFTWSPSVLDQMDTLQITQPYLKWKTWHLLKDSLIWCFDDSSKYLLQIPFRWSWNMVVSKTRAHESHHQTIQWPTVSYRWEHHQRGNANQDRKK